MGCSFSMCYLSTHILCRPFAAPLDSTFSGLLSSIPTDIRPAKFLRIDCVWHACRIHRGGCPVQRTSAEKSSVQPFLFILALQVLESFAELSRSVLVLARLTGHPDNSRSPGSQDT